MDKQYFMMMRTLQAPVVGEFGKQLELELFNKDG